ncbi:tetratricopeptide repeat protein [Sulfurimonas sp. SAG-AH-194-C20]|nr:tetratricopeptide repeat protein [Sulfurimonas sp. SAG-AH-194-C20]MDF1878384.1 tetratricopeptide repeat protein [Sulfurimonas sp. SAG-AH-194-C20]
MKKVILFLFMSLSLFAKAEDSCYTVQLISSYNNEKNLSTLQSVKYPKSCKIMQIGKSLTVRCGCFDKYDDAQLHKNNFGAYGDIKLATTYKYRFLDDVSVAPKKNINLSKLRNLKKRTHKVVDDRPRNQRDEELRLMLQVFLYKGDLENGYRVATLGFSANPNSYYWNQKMAEICKWTNRSARSMKHLRFMYDTKRDPIIEKELIDYGSSAYQYEAIEPLVVNRAIADPSEKNIDLMILVYKMVGSPEKVVKILEAQYIQDPTNVLLLTKALELSLEMGDLVLAKKYVTMIEETKPYSKVDATLIAHYYYIKQDIPRAYKSMLHVAEDKKLSGVKLKKYYQLKSDFAWYLQKNSEAAEASYMLFYMNETRLADYERVSYVYQKKRPKRALLASQRAYEEYQLSYLFYTYANGALNNKEYKNVQIFISQIDTAQSPLINEALYWLIKARVYQHYKLQELEQNALLVAYELEPDNFQIKQELLWSYMDKKDYMNIRIILSDMAESGNLGLSQYLTLANGYLFLSDVNRASFYTQELLANQHELTKSLEFKFLQAYIYQVQNEESAFRKSMKNIVNTLDIKALEKPSLKYQSQFLSDYLRAAMYVFNPDKFEKKLKVSKQFLKRKEYNDISYSWAIQNKAFDKSFKIYHRMKKRELWTKFSNALLRESTSKINNILDLYLHSIARGDAASAADNYGRISLAQSITYEALYTNDKNQNAYIQHLDLSKKRSDKFDMTTSYYDRNPLLQKYVMLNNSTYLTDGYYLDLGLDYFLNESINSTLLVNVPDDKLIAKLGIRKLFNRGEVSLYTAYHNSMESYIEYGMSADYRVASTLRVGAKLSKNIDTLESTQLLLGGKKDMIDFHASWKILNSTTISLLREFNNYKSQDSVNLGDGTYDRIVISKQIRNGYPDLNLGVFYDTGSYSETSGSRGVVDDLQLEDFAVLPNNFYNLGVSISYGVANRNLYTRVWRPYFEFSPYYNNDIDSITYSFNAGYGGKIFHQDHLVFGVSYADSVNGIGGSILELFVNYQFMYYHP